MSTSSHQFQAAERQLQGIITEAQSSPTGRLPTEDELARVLSVGRHTVRRAVQHYVDQGVVERVRGKGSFVLKSPRQVVFSGWIGTEPPGDRAIEALISTAAESDRALSVHYEPIPYYQTLERIAELALGGNAPDVMQLTPPLLATLQELGLLMPLDGVVNHTQLKRRYPVDIESGRFGRQLYAVTWGLSPLVLYYNKNVLEQAGLDSSRPPTTLDEFTEMAERVNQSDDPGIWGTALPLSVEDPVYLWLYPYFLAFGGGFLDRTSGNVTLSSAENNRALEWLKRVYDRGSIPGVKGINEGRLLFGADRIGFWIDGPWLRGLLTQLSGFKEEFASHYDVTTIPIGDTGSSESVLWNHSLAISRQCKAFDAAYSWIEHLVSDETSAKTHFEILGMLPPLHDTLHSPDFASDRFAAVCVNQMNSVSNFPIHHPLFMKSVPFVSHVVSEVIRRGLDTAEQLSFIERVIGIINQNDSLRIISH